MTKEILEIAAEQYAGTTDGYVNFAKDYGLTDHAAKTILKYIEDKKGKDIDSYDVLEYIDKQKLYGSNLWAVDIGEIAQAYANGVDIQKEFKLAPETFEALLPVVAELAGEFSILDKQMQAYGESVVANTASEKVNNYQYSEAVTQAFGKAFQASITDEAKGVSVADTSDRTVMVGSKVVYSADNLSEVSKENSYFLEIAKQYGLTKANFTGDDYNDLKTLYTKMGGTAEYANTDEGKAAMAEWIAESQFAKDYAAQMDGVVDKMKALPEDMQELYAAALAGDAGGLTLKEITELGELKPDDLITFFGFEPDSPLAK
jgi:hypothetical protein